MYPEPQVTVLALTFDSVPFLRHAWKTVLVLGLVSAATAVVTPRATTALMTAMLMATNERPVFVFTVAPSWDPVSTGSLGDVLSSL
jgi:uncharacterized membrane protein YccC